VSSKNEIEGLIPLSQSVFGINQCIVKSIMILVSKTIPANLSCVSMNRKKYHDFSLVIPNSKLRWVILGPAFLIAGYIFYLIGV